MARKTQKSLLNFNGGIWSSKLDGRIDLDRYSYACRQLENFLIRPYGTIDRRPGTKYIRHTKDNGVAIVQEFQFSTDVGYIMEVGDSYMRFYKDQAQVTESVAITASSWTGGVATYTVAAHNLKDDDVVTVTGVTPSGYNVTDERVVGTTATTFDLEIADDPGGVGTGFGAVTQPFEVVTPYAEADLYDLQFRQINDVVYVTHQDYEPHILRRLTNTTFDFAPVVFNLPPFRSENVSEITLTPSAKTAAGTTVTLTASAKAWAASYWKSGQYVIQSGEIYVCLENHTGTVFATDLAASKWELVAVFASDNVGGYYRIGHKRPSSVIKQTLVGGTNPGTQTEMEVLGTWNFRTTGRWAGTVKIERENPNTGVWETIRETQVNDADRNIDIVGSESVQSNLRITVNTTVPASGVGDEEAYSYLEAAEAYIYGYGKVTAVNSNISADVTVISPFISIGASDVWAESSWSDRRGWPRTCDMHEQRVVYAGNKDQPLMIWGSKIADFQNFLWGVNDDDAFFYSIPSTEQNPIEWIVGGKSILIGNGKEYGIMSSGSDDLPITPSNAVYRVQEAVGFTNIKPQIIGPIFAGVERNGQRLREIAYQFDSGVSGGYKARDLNRLNDEIAGIGGIQDIAYSQLREPYIFAVMVDGSVGALAYNRDDGVAGWSKFSTGPNAQYFQSVAVIRGTDNDEVYFTTSRNPGTGGYKNYVEIMKPETWIVDGVDTRPRDAYYVDCGIEATTFLDTLSALWYKDIATFTTDGNHNLQVGDLVTTEQGFPTGWNKNNTAIVDVNTVVGDGAITASANTLTSATGLFTNAMVGSAVTVEGAGAAGVDLVTTISVYNSATSVDLTDNAATTVTGSHVIVAYASKDQLSIRIAPDPGTSPVTPPNLTSNRVRGLKHLENQTIDVLGEGSPYQGILVDSTGEVLLSSTANKIKAGIPYATVYEPMRIDIDSILGSSQGHKKIISQINIRVKESIGCTLDNGIQADLFPFNDTDDLMDVAVPLFTGEKRIDWASTYGLDPDLNDPKLIISQTQPLPLSLLALIVEYSIT